MTYSRKGRLLFRGATIAVAVALIAFVELFHPSRNIVPYLVGAVIILVFAFGIRSFLFLDEIQQTQRLRAGFYGGMLGVGAAMLILVGITLQPSLLEALADTFHRHRPHLPLEYFVLGVLTPLVAQTICSLAASVAMRLKSGA